MIELRRRVLKPIEIGDLCSMNGSLREALLLTDDYQENGNVSQNITNYQKKIHVADVHLFYCANANAFNSKDMIEIVPVLFLHDGTYGDASFRLGLRNRMKLTVPRKDFFIIQDIASLDQQSMIKRNVSLVAKKFNLNMERWERNLAGN